MEESKKCSDAVKQDLLTVKSSLEKLKEFEKDILNVKKDNGSEKISVIEKEMLSLRVDHEKSLKEVKALSTELKFIDSNNKKESSNSKSEISTLSKSFKGMKKLNTRRLSYHYFIYLNCNNCICFRDNVIINSIFHAQSTVPNIALYSTSEYVRS